MNYTNMTDEALALMSTDLDAARVPAKAHAPGGIDGRCYDCDARPHSWHRVACI